MPATVGTMDDAWKKRTLDLQQPLDDLQRAHGTGRSMETDESAGRRRD